MILNRLADRSRAGVALLICAAIVLGGCQPSTLISTLEAVVSAAEIALPVIGAVTGLPFETSALIARYLQSVDAAVMQASAILAGPGTAADKSARITEAFSRVASGCDCVPPGTPIIVVAVVAAVVKAIERFLANITAPQSLVGAGRQIKISRADRAALADIRNRAEQQLAKLKGATN